MVKINPFLLGCWLALALLTPAGAAPGDPLATAQQLVDQRHFSDALKAIDSTPAAQALAPRRLFLRGLILTELGRRDEAMTTFKKLTIDYPELPEPYNNLAVLQAQAGQFDQARASLELAVRLQPSNPMALENLGDLYLRLAMQAYDHASQLNPKAVGAQRKREAFRALAPASDSAR